MRVPIVVLTMAALAGLSTALSDAAMSLSGAFTLTGKVVNVIDGDTFDIVLDDDGTKERVRMLGINTPERHACYYKEATAFTRSLLSGQVWLSRAFAFYSGSSGHR